MLNWSLWFPFSLTRAMALDCEMVGVGPKGEESIAARVSVVNQHGKCVYDKYVKPTEPVTDYRTAVSGVRPEHLRQGTSHSSRAGQAGRQRVGSSLAVCSGALSRATGMCLSASGVSSRGPPVTDLATSPVPTRCFVLGGSRDQGGVC